MVGFPGRTMVKAPAKAPRDDGNRGHIDTRAAPRAPAARRPHISAANNTQGRTYSQSSDTTLGSFNTLSSGYSNEPATPSREAEPATVIMEGPGDYSQSQWTGSQEETYRPAETRNWQWTDDSNDPFGPRARPRNPNCSPFYDPREIRDTSLYSGKEVAPRVQRGPELEGGTEFDGSRNPSITQTSYYENVESSSEASSYYRAPISPYAVDQNRPSFQPSAIPRRNTSEGIETRISDPRPSYAVPTGPLTRRHTDFQQNTSHESDERLPDPFEAEVDVWQDGLRDPDTRKTAILNFVILKIDTGCQRSNWVSKQIIDRLRASTQPLRSTPEFFSFNGTPLTPENVVRLSFRSTEGGPGPAHTAMFYVAAGQVPFEMLLGQDYIYHNGILPKANLRGVWVLTSNTQNKDAQREQTVRDAKQRNRAAKHERYREQQQREKAARSSRQNSGNTGSTSGNGKLVGWFGK